MAFKKLTAGLMASSMILGLASTAMAEITTATPFETASKMNKLGIVMGVGTNPDGTIDFNLGGNLTRAELVTTIVRSFGAETSAQLAKGAPSFADVSADAWYSGYVAVAKNLAEQAGTTIGRDSNSFDPMANVSKAEALVFVMKFLGIKVESTGANWYEAWIAKAVELGIISEADAAVALANPGTPANRGEAFIILDFGYSAKVLEGGKSLYTGFVDAALPTVEVAAPVESTVESKITISGKASDNKGVASVAVNGTAVDITDGNFSAEVELAVGPNSVVVTATDVAGNTASETFTVTRVNAAATSLEAADITVAAGGSVTVAAVVKDANGEAIADADVTGTSTLGTFEAGTFKAGEKAGEGTLTLAYGELTKEIKVTVTAGELAEVSAPTSIAPDTVVALSATDAYGNAVSGVTFAVKGSDKAFVDPAGNFFANEAGVYTVVATKDGKSVEATVGVYGDLAALKVETVAEMVGNNTTEYTITVYTVDAEGSVLPIDEADAVAVTFGSTTTAAADVVDGVATFKITAEDSLVGEDAAVISAIGEGTTVDNTIKGETTTKVVAQVATSVKVNVHGAKYLVSNTLAGNTVTVSVVDQAGAKMLDGEWTVDVTLTGPVTFSDGKTTKTLEWNVFTESLVVKPNELGAVGEVTISATAEGLTAGSAKLTAAVAQVAKNIVLEGPAADETTLEADEDTASEALEYAISLTDKNGVPVTTADPVNYTIVFDGIADEDLDQTFVSFDGVTFTSLDLLDGVATVDAEAANGWGSFWVKGSKAGTYSVSVKHDETTPTLTTSGKLSYNVTPEATPAEVALTSGETINTLRGATNTLTFELLDTFGNKVAKKDVVVTLNEGGVAAAGDFKINGKNDAAVTAKTDANGEVTFEVVSSVLSGTADFTASIGGIDADAVTVNAVAQIAKTVSVTKVEYETSTAGVFAPYAGSLNADAAAIRLTVSVKDQDGFALSGVEGDLAVAATNEDWKLDLTGVTWTETATAGVYESSDITLTKSGSSAFTVTVENVAAEVKASSRTIAVRAGALASVRVAGATYNTTSGNYDLDVEAGKLKEITVNLVDMNGNTVLGSAVGEKIAVAFENVASATYVSFRDADGNELIADGIEIAVNRTTGKFFLISGDVAGSFDVAIYDEADVLIDVITIDLK